jgi:hypothetical protein
MNTWWLWFVETVPLLLWQCAWLGGLFFVVLGYYGIKNKWLVGCGIAGCFLVLIAALFMSCYAYTQRCCWVRVLDECPVHVGPASWYHTVGMVKKGEIVCITNKCHAWHCCRAKTCDGWIYLLNQR